MGGARTALFNWLFARRHRGRFLLRIEDTDLARSSDKMVEGILEGLRWLGIDWDEGPYYQSHRLERYRTNVEALVRSGAAYHCFCSPTRLKEKQEAAVKINQTWSYDRTCLRLPSDQVAENLNRGVPYAVRFKVPSGATRFRDLVHGPIEVDNETIEDFVLLRSDGVPTYHLSVVADDIEMAITHVVRGADHISNTPKQILLYHALRKQPPEFAHLPLILGPDKRRLSKRHGATSVMAYKELGYVPEAVVNFLALLGWSPGGNRELLSRTEMVALFSLENVNKTNAVFDLQKLEWMNGQYIASLPEERLSALLKEELMKSGLWRDTFETTEWFRRVVNLFKPRIKRLTEFPVRARAFFTEEFEYDPEAVETYLNEPALQGIMKALRDRYAALSSFDPQSTEHALRNLAETFNVRAGVVIGALRVALTGKSASPGIFDVVVTLGRERTLARLDRLISFLSTKVFTNR